MTSENYKRAYQLNQQITLIAETIEQLKNTLAAGRLFELSESQLNMLPSFKQKLMELLESEHKQLLKQFEAL